MGKSTPPQITTGSYVAWDGGKGRVDLIVTSGKVPGVEEDVEGTDKSPAARVVVWEDGKATGRKIGASTHTLRRTPPIKGTKALLGRSGLVEVLAEHEDTVADLGLPTHARLTGKALTTVYDRGLASWPGSEVTTLSAEEWATGRVEHLVKVAQGVAEAPGNDVDLLDPEHPLAPVVDEEQVRPYVPADGEVSLFDDEPADESGDADESTDEDLFGEDATETPGEPDEDDVEEKAEATEDGDTVTLSREDLDADLAAILGDLDED